MLNAQMLAAPIQLMKLQLHSRPGLVCRKRDLGLRDRRGKCARNLLRIKWITPKLELRGVQEDFAHNRKEISSLHPELGLRHVPGKSVQRRGQTQRFWALFPCAALLHTARNEVVGIPYPPGRLYLPAVYGLTIRSPTSTLTFSNSWIGTEPTMTVRAGFLLSVRHWR
jgi:hypothetical protein